MQLSYWEDVNAELFRKLDHALKVAHVEFERAVEVPRKAYYDAISSAQTAYNRMTEGVMQEYEAWQKQRPEGETEDDSSLPG